MGEVEMESMQPKEMTSMSGEVSFIITPSSHV